MKRLLITNLINLFSNITVIFFCFFIFLLFPKNITLSAEFQTDYQIEYFVLENNNKYNTQVNFKIKITNLRSDIFVSKFSVAYPKSFIVSNLIAYDDLGKIIPEITEDNTKIKINLKFNAPKTGRGSVNNFYLKFNQENLFRINGNIVEAILPTIEKKEEDSYKIIVNLPTSFNRKISISKPKPTYILKRQIIWENPQVKTIYAVFGDRQFYKAQLNYNLKNPKIFPIKTEIAFPPDTLYQKIYLKKVDPPPYSVKIDEDGNFLGQYLLAPQEEKKIIFDGIIEVFTNPRTEIIPYIRSQFANQKKYLLTAHSYWLISDLEKFKSLTTVKDIYDFVVNKLSYDYKRLTKGNLRQGADKVLANPDQAVCTEFTDLFIALTREKGIWSREIQGYGFSNDINMRPISLNSDILHSWPEYYDNTRNIWIPIDPTWENTSGIDYFSSFDLNHVVFVIHGKKPNYPLPAGMYKIEESKDIQIAATNEKPVEILNIKISHIKLPPYLTEKQSIKNKLVIKNNGNTYLWEVPVRLVSQDLEFNPKEVIINSIAPFEEKQILVNFIPKTTNYIKKTFLSIQILDKEYSKYQVIVIPYLYQLLFKVSLILFLVAILFLAIKKIAVLVIKKND